MTVIIIQSSVFILTTVESSKIIKNGKKLCLIVILTWNFNIFVYPQKLIIIAFALIVAASCDVSHIATGDGWFKDESGYHYDKPQGKLDDPEIEIEEIVVATEEPFVDEVVTEIANDYLPPIDYLPPTNDLKEYLPPKTEDAKRKRQVPVRKAYRRFVKKH